MALSLFQANFIGSTVVEEMAHQLIYRCRGKAGLVVYPSQPELQSIHRRNTVSQMYLTVVPTTGLGNLGPQCSYFRYHRIERCCGHIPNGSCPTHRWILDCNGVGVSRACTSGLSYRGCEHRDLRMSSWCSLLMGTSSSSQLQQRRMKDSRHTATTLQQ